MPHKHAIRTPDNSCDEIEDKEYLPNNLQFSAYFKEIPLGDQMDIMVCNMGNTIILLLSSICVRHKARRPGVSAPYRGSGQRPGSQSFYWDLKAIEHISIIKITTVDAQNLMIKDNFMSKPCHKKKKKKKKKNDSQHSVNLCNMTFVYENDEVNEPFIKSVCWALYVDINLLPNLIKLYVIINLYTYSI